MRRVTGWQLLAFIIFAVGFLTACGQKGDLYLPEGNAQTIEVA